MKRLVLQFGFLLMAILLFAPTAVHAVPAPIVQNVTVTVNVPECFGIIVLNEDGLETSDLAWIGQDAPDKTNFDAVVPAPWEALGYGWTSKKVLTVRVFANAGWKLWIKGAPDSFFDGPPGGLVPKPMSDILWQDGDPDDIWRALTPSDFLVKTKPAAPAIPPGYFNEAVSFHVLLHYAHDYPGTYTYHYIQFTITAD